jgi:hypothetical protein
MTRLNDLPAATTARLKLIAGDFLVPARRVPAAG